MQTFAHGKYMKIRTLANNVLIFVVHLHTEIRKTVSTDMRKILLLLLTILLSMSTSQETRAAQGWPENYGGVMLQGFYWDSFGDTQWTVLEQQADELAASFSLIWVPQSGKCLEDYNTMGYTPYYYFNQNSSFGTEAELRSMIKTFKQKGLGTVADVVVNHHNTNGWWGFPAETYNGVTYQFKTTDVVANDDGGAAKAQAQKDGVTLSANNDEGEGWGGMRDLDHKSQNVQTIVKAYVKYLKDDLGYTGFRYDMVKGFSGSHVADYNDYANIEYSVGECWDGTTTIKNWINATSKKSAAFDFQFKYIMRNAVDKNNWTYLGTYNDNNTSNYALIKDPSYSRYAVTFVENHDTEVRPDGSSNGPLRRDTLAANAFMLAMPGTPCVFLKHWQAYKPEIAAMIAARKAAGITNTSTYTNLASDIAYYANSIADRLVVVVGSNTQGYVPSLSDWTEILSGYHYKYYMAKTQETAWADCASGQYVMPLSVRLTAVSKTAGAQLVYTTDGSNPTAASQKAASGTEITLTGGCTLKVGLLRNGTVSGIITRQYTEKEAEPVVTPTYVEGKVFAYFEKPATWGTGINVWAWQKGKGGEDYLGTGWPGVRITKLGITDSGNELWQWISTSSIVPDYIIFNDGSSQTQDLPFQNGGYYTSSGLQSVITGIRGASLMDKGERIMDKSFYDLQGRRVQQPTRPGIYIRGGRKYVKAQH